MRLNAILRRQHIGYHFDLHWHVKGKRAVQSTGAEEELQNKNIPIYKAEDLLNTQQKCELVDDIPNYISKPLKYDHTHPYWHDRICYTYKDNNVLLEGLDQAKIITKTVEIQEGLPNKLNFDVSLPSNKKVRELIFNSYLFDAEQKLLPIVKDPLRPAWVFPRTYGITPPRINKLLITRLLNLIESENSTEVTKKRHLFKDLKFLHTFEKLEDLFQINIRGDALLTSSLPLRQITDQRADDVQLPDLYPIKHTITLNQDQIYEIRNVFPINKTITIHHPHTLFIYYDSREVKNLFEEEVTEKQIEGRSLMKTFAVAASYAKQTYGDNVQVLPKPVTLQCVHTDGRMFHFGILQLNTLDLANGGIKNIWYHNNRIPLFTNCSYNLGKPTLEGYNNTVIKILSAFYANV